MRRDAEYFGEQELELIHIARTLRGARKLERMLSERSIDYLVHPGRYQANFLFIFPTERVGAYFYVPGEVAASCRELLREARLQVVEVDDEDEGSPHSSASS